VGQTPAEGVIFGHTVEGSLLGTVLVRPHPPGFGEFRMRKFLLIVALAALTPAAANAATWVAICNDGQHVQYNHTLGGAGLLYLSNPMTNGLQIARLDQTSASRTMVCGAVTGNSPPVLMPPVSQVCINMMTKTINLMWHDPIHPATPAKDMGPFCKATITIH
jgi:hypothetical protein